MSQRIFIAGLLTLATLGYSDAPVTPALPPAGFSQRKDDIPHGTVTNSIQYPTRNHGNRPVRIYTPPGYSATAAVKYPVLYLLHGIGGNENAWSGSEGNAGNVIDFLLSQNLCKPMIVVMPFGNMTGTTGDTWNNFEDVLKNDLIPYVQSNYAASADSNMRAIAGLSWGGGQALTYGFRNYTKFTYIAGFSPAPNMASPASVITNPAAVNNVVNFCFISSGTEEAGSQRGNYDVRAAAHHDFWTTNNITPHIYTIEPGVGHEAANWNRNLYNYAQRLFTATPTGITLNPRRDGSRDQTRFTRIITHEGFPGMLAGWSGKGVFTLDGRSLPQATQPQLFEAIPAP